MGEDWWNQEERTTSKLFRTCRYIPWKRWLIIAGLCLVIIAGEVWIKGEVAAGKKDLSSLMANIFAIAGLAISLVQTIFAISSNKMSGWQKELVRRPHLVRTIDIVMVIVCLLGIGTVSLLPYSFFQPGNSSARIPTQEARTRDRPEQPTRVPGVMQQPVNQGMGAGILPTATQSVHITQTVPSPTVPSPVATPMARPTPLITVTPTPDANKACRTHPFIWQARPGAYSTVPQVKKECLNRIIVGVHYLPAPIDIRYCPLSGELFCHDWITFTQPESWQFIANNIPSQTSFYLQYKAHDPTLEPFGVVGWLTY